MLTPAPYLQPQFACAAHDVESQRAPAVGKLEAYAAGDSVSPTRAGRMLGAATLRTRHWYAGCRQEHISALPEEVHTTWPPRGKLAPEAGRARFQPADAASTSTSASKSTSAPASGRQPAVRATTDPPPQIALRRFMAASETVDVENALMLSATADFYGLGTAHPASLIGDATKIADRVVDYQLHSGSLAQEDEQHWRTTLELSAAQQQHLEAMALPPAGDEALSAILSQSMATSLPLHWFDDERLEHRTPIDWMELANMRPSPVYLGKAVPPDVRVMSSCRRELCEDQDGVIQPYNGGQLQGRALLLDATGHGRWKHVVVRAAHPSSNCYLLRSVRDGTAGDFVHSSIHSLPPRLKRPPPPAPPGHRLYSRTLDESANLYGGGVEGVRGLLPHQVPDDADDDMQRAIWEQPRSEAVLAEDGGVWVPRIRLQFRAEPSVGFVRRLLTAQSEMERTRRLLALQLACELMPAEEGGAMPATWSEGILARATRQGFRGGTDADDARAAAVREMVLAEARLDFQSVNDRLMLTQLTREEERPAASAAYRHSASIVDHGLAPAPPRPTIFALQADAVVKRPPHALPRAKLPVSVHLPTSRSKLGSSLGNDVLRCGGTVPIRFRHPAGAATDDVIPRAIYKVTQQDRDAHERREAKVQLEQQQADAEHAEAVASLLGSSAAQFPPHREANASQPEALTFIDRELARVRARAMQTSIIGAFSLITADESYWKTHHARKPTPPITIAERRLDWRKVRRQLSHAVSIHLEPHSSRPVARTRARLLMCAFAAQAGHVEVLAHMRRLGYEWDDRTPLKAAAAGHLATLEFARHRGCPWTADTCAAAAASGHLDCLAYVRNAGCPWDARVCEYAVGNGHLEVYLWAVREGAPCAASVRSAAEWWIGRHTTINVT